ncbi:CpsD/CapB family tyrosine-protein kinase [Carnobacterium maltaromaticum]|uniref:non-specific protein-tyrosine kinase n=1 Tax=Carnobacterium maltaromaticum TaxID=2751 RepID=A0AAW9KAU7_CARML|nr:CpsD/CapB family tyrosine-protein kinase [Carnobacterium maltaromaticum]MDZ5759253.1 CpsD/CapB family tyrosine-protein kinase [Carnobacterium maltaromaticum]
MIKHKNKEEYKLIVATNPESQISEQFRSIRTSVEFSLLQDTKILVVTSSEQNSGKTLISSNLALAFAQKGKKTLLIDADMRNPSIAKYFYTPVKYGLSNLIRKKVKIEEAICETNEKNLSILSTGFFVPNPSDLLGGIGMKELIDTLRNKFDQIIIDTPPVLVAADATLVASHSDGIVFVVRAGKTNKYNAKKALRLVESSGTPIIGAVVNDVKMKKNENYYAASYYKGGGSIR